MNIETFLALGGIAVVLVALNFALQRVASPDKGYDVIAGCCGMALPEEITLSHLNHQGDLGQTKELSGVAKLAEMK